VRRVTKRKIFYECDISRRYFPAFGPRRIAIAALFSGSAIYINIVEQPVRLQLDDHPFANSNNMAESLPFSPPIPRRTASSPVPPSRPVRTDKPERRLCVRSRDLRRDARQRGRSAVCIRSPGPTITGKHDITGPRHDTSTYRHRRLLGGRRSLVLPHNLRRGCGDCRKLSGNLPAGGFRATVG
jgi:hypothetical protein